MEPDSNGRMDYGSNRQVTLHPCAALDHLMRGFNTQGDAHFKLGANTKDTVPSYLLAVLEEWTNIVRRYRLVRI